MREAFIDKEFRNNTLRVIDAANDIIDTYLEQGLRLTLRQLYYRFVATDLLSNTQQSYNRLGSIVNDARLAGHIDWDAIEDRGRNLQSWSTWRDPAAAVRSIRRQYRIDKWTLQDYRVEVWVEKQALEAIVERGCGKREAKHIACKGYMSQSEMYVAAKRFERYQANGQMPVIIHLGDHDPSGIDMTRDIDDRLALFGIPMEVNRIALNMDQVDEYEPPPNPAKMTDSRYAGYITRFGSHSWELDALEPQVLIQLITDTIDSYVDEDAWQERQAEEDHGREQLQDFEQQATEED